MTNFYSRLQMGCTRADILWPQCQLQKKKVRGRWKRQITQMEKTLREGVRF